MQAPIKYKSIGPREITQALYIFYANIIVIFRGITQVLYLFYANIIVIFSIGDKLN